MYASTIETTAPANYEQLRDGLDHAIALIQSGEITHISALAAHPDDQLFWAGSARYLCR